MPKYKFSDIAFNSTQKKKPTEEDKEVYVGLEHLDSGSLVVTRWGAEVAPVGEKLLMKKGDVLFGKRRAYQKKVAIAPFDGIFSAHGMVLRPNEAVVTKEYFPLFISSDYFLDEAIQISVGSLSPTVNWKDLKQLEFDLPSIEEQNKIAPVIWAAIDAKNRYKTLIQTTDDLVKSQFIEQSAIWGKDYVERPLEEYLKVITYGFTNPMPDSESGPWKVTAKDINAGKINFDTARKTNVSDFEQLTNKSKPKIGDVLLTKDGTLGRVAIVDTKDICINQSVALLRCNNKLLPEFLCCVLQMPLYQHRMLENAGGVTVKHLYITRVNKMDILVPDMDAQLQWVQFLKQTDKSKFELQQAVEKIDSLIKSLIQ